MAKAFIVTKLTEWTRTSTGEKGQTLSLAYKGRVMTCNPADFGSDLKVLPAVLAVVASRTGANAVPASDAKPMTCIIDGSMEIVVEKYIDTEGITKNGLRLKPKFDLDINEFGV